MPEMETDGSARQVGGKCIYLYLMGGLGNQLFQYAYAIAVARRHGVRLILDLYWYEDPARFRLEIEQYRLSSFSIPEPTTVCVPTHWSRKKDRLYRKLFNRYGILCSGLRLKGYWVGLHFFEAVSGEVRQLLRFPPLKSAAAKSWQHRIQKTAMPVFMHVRRGDFIHHKGPGEWRGTFDVCGPGYFRRAADHVRRQLASPSFFVFSDDLDWCRRHLHGQDLQFVEGVSDSIETLALMKQCRGSIIANSTFSWWGAWLGEQEHSRRHLTMIPNRWSSTKKTNDTFMHKWRTIPPHWHPLAVEPY